MKYIDHGRGGDADVLQLAERDMPEVGAGEVLIRVAYAGVNRPDVLQRMGSYPPPRGASPWLGLEVSGVVAAVGQGVPEWKKGELVEILSVGDSQHPPMEAEGVKIGLVQEIDPSDGTTKLLYHSGETGKIGGGWFRNDNLRRYGPRPADEIALLGPVVEPTA